VTIEAVPDINAYPFGGIWLELEAIADAVDEGGTDPEMAVTLAESVLNRISTHNTIHTDKTPIQPREAVWALTLIARVATLGIELLRPPPAGGGGNAA
jgi:exosome complex RNA-binding protein Rrp42 (RNase PH superfamily)